jgi:hypothetical protein
MIWVYKTMKAKLIVIITLFVSLNAQAASFWGTAKVQQVRAFTKQTEQYIIVSGFSNPQGCPNYTNALVLLKDGNTNWQMVHSLLTTALVSGKRISVRVSGCKDSIPIIDGVSLLAD